MANTQSGTKKRLKKSLDWQFKKKGQKPMSVHILHACLTLSAKQRNTSDKKEAVMVCKSSHGIWSDWPKKPARWVAMPVGH